MSSFGEGKYRRQSTRTVNVKYKDRKPWVIFRFLYRKRGGAFVVISEPVPIQVYVTDILKAQRILPRSPSPSPPPDNLPGPSSRVEGRKNWRAGVKREREDDMDIIELLSDDDDGEDSKDDLMSLQVTRFAGLRPGM